MAGDRTDEYMEMVEDCEARSKRMSPWEVGFIESIREQLENKTVLSLRQIETLEKI